MDKSELKAEILKAIVIKDKPRLKELKLRLKRLQWIESFNGNVPVSAWIDESNPFIKWVSTTE